MKGFEGKVVLVTGASGFIGAVLAQKLAMFKGIKLLLLSRGQNHTLCGSARWITKDLNHLDQDYWHSMDVTQIDYVFHLGAFTPKSSAQINDLKNVIENNVSGTAALLKSIPGNKTRIIFSSTLDVYERFETRQVLSESSRVRPTSLYGSSKLFCEDIVRDWASSCERSYAILRYGHIYGPGEEKYKKFIPIALSKIFSNESVLIYGDGSTLRDYLYVDDAVEATVRAALIPENIPSLNIVRGKSVSLKEVGELLVKLTRSLKGTQVLKDKPTEASIEFDNSLMKAKLGEWNLVGFEKGLKEEIESFQRNIVTV